VVYRRGEKVTAIYQVVSGRVQFSVLTASGKEVLYVPMVKGDCFGELGIFDGKPAHQDGVADIDTVLMRLSVSDLHKLRQAYPEINEALLAFFARRVRSVYEILDDSYLLDVPHRLARRVLLLLHRAQQHDGSAARISVSHDDLAKMVGSTRPNVTAILKTWERNGWIAQTYGSIECLEPDRLAKFISD
jgi:CRP-like cAMP-binding protein